MFAFAAALECAALLATAQASAAWAGAEATPARVELHSKDFLIVAVVRGPVMTLHVSRALDNSAVRDAAVSIVLRGSTYPATATVDGGYEVKTPDLGIPGAATVEFRITAGDAQEWMRGTLDIGAGEVKDGGTNLRQMGWWVLNFSVCIGFLMLISRRRKARVPD